MNPFPHRHLGCSPRSRQGGAVLFISLIVLILMTIVGLGAMQGTGLDERMAGNLRERTLAFEAAEAALREAGEALGRFEDPTGGGLVYARVSPAASPAVAEIEGSDGRHIDPNGATAVALAGVAQLPRFLVEEVGFVCPGGCVESEALATRDGADYYYAITALGYGRAVRDNGVPQSRVMLQSILPRRF